MKLEIDKQRIPFMSWSAGQKEFLPLLLSFYCLSRIPNSIIKAEEFTTVIIEEPEMGLHPKAILSIILEIIDLMASGYRVILSTHSNTLLEFAWAFNAIRSMTAEKNFKQALCKLFDMNKENTTINLFDNLYEKKIYTYMFSLDTNNGRVLTKDISTLDAGSEDNSIAEWGGLSWFSSKTADLVMEYTERYNEF